MAWAAVDAEQDPVMMHMGYQLCAQGNVHSHCIHRLCHIPCKHMWSSVSQAPAYRPALRLLLKYAVAGRKAGCPGENVGKYHDSVYLGRCGRAAAMVLMATVAQ